METAVTVAVIIGLLASVIRNAFYHSEVKELRKKVELLEGLASHLKR